MQTIPSRPAPPRWAAWLLAAAVLVLVPWTLALGYRLPARHTSSGWDVAWVGLDVGLALALATTGLGLARRQAWASGAATCAATILACDAWFDNVLADGLGEHVEAALEALFVELPLAVLCVWLARRRPRDD